MNGIPQTAWMRERVGRIDPHAFDAFVVVLAAAANSIAISAAREPASREPDVLAYGFGLIMAILLLGRRRWPVAVLLMTAAILTLYFQLDYPGFFPGVPLAVPLYTAAASGGVAWSVAVSAWWVVITAFYQVLATPRAIARIASDALTDGGLFAAIVLLGVIVRGRRIHAAEASDRIRRAEAESERVAEELRVARLVQEQFLPARVPDLPGWQISAFYRSAREVGGDFYSFVELPADKLGIAIGDVTDKGAPAALVMSATQGLLRAEAPGEESPSAVLKTLNEVLVLNTPERMFVTCLYMVLDPATGQLRFANAGHNLPYMSTNNGVVELRATGMPLGLLPASEYEQKSVVLSPGTSMLLHSDGLTEAHNRDREMFGLTRVSRVMDRRHNADDLIHALLAELDRFTGPEWEQEDDITLVTLERLQR